MKLNYVHIIVFGYLLTILSVINTNQSNTVQVEDRSYVTQKFNGPEEFQAFHAGIRIREGEQMPDYAPGQLVNEFNKARQIALASRKSSSNGVLEWKERGPSNVPGRTRGLVVLPNDPNKNTWLAGSSGGGIWKTTNGGQTWIDKSANFPTLAVATLAMCESSPNIIYAGTGEYIASSGTAINGNGIFKSTDAGETWQQLSSTASNPDFVSITRVIVDPNNPDVVLACSAPNTWGAFSSTIMRSTNGGTSWTKVFNVTQGGAIEQLIATPGNFNVMYAAQKGVGVLKSTDAGQSWVVSNSGMSVNGRLELAISPVNANRIFASAQGTLSGSNSDLYMSNDAGATWSLVDVSINGSYVDFLGGQGWYDNTIACDPFNANIVYFGGVSLFRSQVTTGSSSVENRTAEEAGTTSFMSLVNFNNGNFYGNRIALGPKGNASVDIRFGSGKMQKAHRFLVPEGAAAGVPDASYAYADYVDVPFEVWEVDANGNDVRQLMVSFRDQDRNGVFNLLTQNTDGAATAQSREYVYINNITYNDASPNVSIATTGGHIFDHMYFFWPVLPPAANWNPGNLPTSTFKIIYGTRQVMNANATTVADVYGTFDGKNRFNTFGVDVHPDQHNMVMIPMSANTYKILLSNDGGIFVSNTSSTPGIVNGDWNMVGRTFNTSQFYGADKRPGYNEYIGGMQDNGTWKSPLGINASASTDYSFNIGGDGFEVLWHNHDDNKLIGGSQGNNFRRSIDGGNSWSSATSGLTGTQPFISKLANSKDNPEVIFTVSSDGVFKSVNFGSNWSLTPIAQYWGASTFLDVEVSRANANTIWAGSGMTATRRLHVSTDGGATFNYTNNFEAVTLGSISKLATHPFEPNTAYALFSFAKGPKVLRTTDLGQTWHDISGFGTGTISVNGFPDVAVYCLYVRPDNPNIIWVGSEIGIIESTDNGQSWSLLTDFPSASVWDMKGQDDQVVIATHGRGIWTAKIESPQIIVKHPEVIAFGTTPQKNLVLRIKLDEGFDNVDVFESSTTLGSLTNATPGEYLVTISNISPGAKNIKFVSYKGNAPFHSKMYAVQVLNLMEQKDAHSTYFGNANDLLLSGFSLQQMPDATTSERKTLHTQHGYVSNANYTAIIRHPIKVSATMPTITYEDIVLVEPGVTEAAFGTADFRDYVAVEATKNGLDWVTLKGYDARYNEQWLQAYTNATLPTKDLFVQHEIDLTEQFEINDVILIRFRLYSNATWQGWGWAINYVNIQQAPLKAEVDLMVENGFRVYPNPTQGIFTIDFTTNMQADVSASVTDMFGREVDALTLGRLTPGNHKTDFNLSTQRNGIYFVTLKAGNKKITERVSVQR